MMVFLMMFISGSISLISSRNHLLMSLLSIEFLVISFFLGFGLVFMKMIMDSYVLMIYLSFSACEGALGLSILVSMVRGHGNDLFMSMGLLQC